MNKKHRKTKSPLRGENVIPKYKLPANSPAEFKHKKGFDRLMINRCCLVHPKQADFGQLTQRAGITNLEVISESRSDQCCLQCEACGNPINAEQMKTIFRVKEMKNANCGNVSKVENSSQYESGCTGCVNTYAKFVDGSRWESIDNINEIERYIREANPDTGKGINSLSFGFATPIEHTQVSKDIHIAEIPKVKIIAEKFSKFKRNNIELRCVEEKIVCVEYDVFDQSSKSSIHEPAQKMRVFFSIKPVHEGPGCGPTAVPSKIKRKFNILDDDLKKFTEKEIAIIDDKIEENKCYLEDLHRILKRNQYIKDQKNKSSLDLKTLYEMAKRESLVLFGDTSNSNLLSKAALQDFKDLILQRATSSAHGMSRKKIVSSNESHRKVGVVSTSIMSELLRNNAKINVFE